MTAAGWFEDPSGRHELRYWDGSQWTAHVFDAGSQSQDAIEAGPRSNDQLAAAPAARRRPEASLIRSPQDAEDAAAEWMRYWGFEDAETTERGADGGVDVRSSQAIAQVKAHMVPIGRPDLQRLHGIAVTEHKMPLFFSLMHYTPQASEWADGVGMPLFRFNHAGEIEPVNEAASVIVADTPDYASQRRGADDDYEEYGVPHGIADAPAAAALERERGGGISGRESLIDVRAAWLLVYVFRLESDHREGIRKIARHHTSFVAVDSFTGGPMHPQVRDAPQIQIPHDCLVGPLSEEDAVQELYRAWRSAARQTRAVDKMRATSELRRLGLPQNADTLTAYDDATVMYPIFVGCMERRGGRRLAVLDGLSGIARRDWSEALTRDLHIIGDVLDNARRIAFAAS